MRYPRADALDALEHLACKLELANTLLATEGNLVLSENDLFGMTLILADVVRKIRQAAKILNRLIPAT
ncbi:MAG: hypothetical protein NTY36_01445 [Deltaproteobacteria bacterium]|nr:hypothetical protein [Deltaproteobacteria bacterium]